MALRPDDFLLLGSEESFAERMEVEECCYFRLGDYFELRLEEYLLSEVGGEFGSEAGRVFGSEAGRIFASETRGVCKCAISDWVTIWN